MATPIINNIVALGYDTTSQSGVDSLFVYTEDGTQVYSTNPDYFSWRLAIDAGNRVYATDGYTTKRFGSGGGYEAQMITPAGFQVQDMVFKQDQRLYQFHYLYSPFDFNNPLYSQFVVYDRAFNLIAASYDHYVPSARVQNIRKMDISYEPGDGARIFTSGTTVADNTASDSDGAVRVYTTVNDIVTLESAVQSHVGQNMSSFDETTWVGVSEDGSRYAHIEWYQDGSYYDYDTAWRCTVRDGTTHAVIMWFSAAGYETFTAPTPEHTAASNISLGDTIGARPTSVDFDRDNNILIQCVDKVVAYDTTGALIYSELKANGAGGQLSPPFEVDSTGNAWIGDGSTVTIFDPVGTKTSIDTGLAGLATIEARKSWWGAGSVGWTLSEVCRDVVELMPISGANGAPALTTSVYGDPQISTTDYKVGIAGGVFDGSDYTQIAANSALTMGTGDYTVELWIKVPDTANGGIWSNRNTSVGKYDNQLAVVGGKLSWSNGSSWALQSAPLSINTWYHCALVRSGGTATMYIDGVSAGSVYWNTNMTGSRQFAVGALTNGALSGRGSFDSVRFSNVARYTADFTPHTTPFIPDANTLVLYHYDKNFYDVNYQSVGFDTTTKKFGSSSITGDGSGYLIADSLVVPQTGEFTIECWFNIPSVQSGYTTFLSNYDSAVTNGSFHISSTTVNNTQRLDVFIKNAAVGMDDFSYVGPPPGGSTPPEGQLALNTWHHVVLQRSDDNSISLYLNGTGLFAQTNSTAINDSNLYIGGREYGVSAPTYLRCHMDEVRISNVARYDNATYTVPSAQYVADADTALLLHFEGTDVIGDENCYTVGSGGGGGGGATEFVNLFGSAQGQSIGTEKSISATRSTVVNIASSAAKTFGFAVSAVSNIGAVLIRASQVSVQAFASSTVLSNLVKSTQSKLQDTVAINATSTSFRAIFLALSATIANTASVVKSSVRNITSAANTVSNIAYASTFNLLISGASNITSTMSRNITKTINAIASTVSTMVKTTDTFFKISTTASTAGNLFKTVGKNVASTFSSVSSIEKDFAIQRVYSAVATTTSSLSKSLTYKLATTATGTGKVLKAFPKALSSSITATAKMVKTLPKTILVTVQTVEGLVKSTLINKGVGLIADIYQAASINKTVNKLTGYSVTATSGIVKSLTYTISKTLAMFPVILQAGVKIYETLQTLSVVVYLKEITDSLLRKNNTAEVSTMEVVDVETKTIDRTDVE